MIDCHFVWDRILAKELEVRFISRKYQIVDILTKPLILKRFAMLTFNLNVRMPMLGLRGCIRSNKDEVSQAVQTLKADTVQAKDKYQEEELHQTSKS